ncbi:MAG: 2-polyprenylphenol 6-hydroxylase [Alphaproteobacteria bacterium]
MLRFARNLARVIGILRTLARFDALFPLELFGLGAAAEACARFVSRRGAPGRPGERLAAALQELGPGFIKFGQMLSTRPDLIGETMAGDLSNLQDRLPPFPGTEARATVEAELGAPLDTLFGRFDDAPVAAASIAQVHFAVTADGREVAVKVLRPGIEDAFARDLDLYYWLAEWIERTQPSWRRLRPIEVVRTLADTVAVEMDLRLEAAAASELRENLAADDGFRVPEIDWRRTARRVLTLARIDGLPIDETAALAAAGHDLDAINEKAARSVFNQVFRDGFFHADLHPGNLFVDQTGDIVAVDFGIMGRLDIETRRYLAEMLLGFLTGDYARVAEVHFEAGYVPAAKSRAAFTQACRAISEPILGLPLNEISLARLLAQLFQVTETFEMETQPQLLLLQKNMLLAEGIGRRLNPEANIWMLVRPLIEEWVKANLGPEARLRDALAEALTAAQRLPRLVRSMETTFADGGIRLHPKTVRALGGGRGGLSPALVLALAALVLALAALF